jgi:integrase
VPDADLVGAIAVLSPSLAKLIELQEGSGGAAAMRPAAAAGSAAAGPVAVGPIPEETAARIRELAARVPGESPVAAMIQLERLTGMRPGELVIMRGCDIDVSGGDWVYVPESHKTEHHDRSRSVVLGPRAREILGPFLKPDLTAYLFSPKDATAARYKWMRRLRKSKVQPSQVDRSKPRPKCSPGLRYDTASYRRAVQYACEKAQVDRWSPNRLRHNCATRVRKEFGIEAARAVLGHTSSAVTEIYAELDQKTATNVMGRLG